jgi:hypothetical protein
MQLRSFISFGYFSSSCQLLNPGIMQIVVQILIIEKKKKKKKKRKKKRSTNLCNIIRIDVTYFLP